MVESSSCGCGEWYENERVEVRSIGPDADVVLSSEVMWRSMIGVTCAVGRDAGGNRGKAAVVI